MTLKTYTRITRQMRYIWKAKKAHQKVRAILVVYFQTHSRLIGIVFLNIFEFIFTSVSLSYILFA